MNDYILVTLDQIDPNPYQTRTEYKAEEIHALALSIAQDTLIQFPVLRRFEKCYQIGVGHKRTEAYKLLSAVEKGFVDGVSPELIAAVKAASITYEMIPAFVQELTDEQMFRFVVSENSQRSDLSPIEEMMAMRRSKAEFNYTSDQIGALFGKEGATVRGIMRLGDLPQEVQVMVHEGRLSQSVARQLITLHRMAPEQIKDALKDIEDGDNPEDVLEFQLRSSDKVKHIYSTDFPVDGKKFKYLPVLRTELIGSEHEEHLLNPPVCTACPFYAKADGSNYCSFIPCFDRKKESHGHTKLETASRATKITIYRETDGSKLQLDRWNDTHKKYVDKRDPDLRLVQAERSNWNYAISNLPEGIGISAVGKLYEKIKKAEAQSAADRGSITKEATPGQIMAAVKKQFHETVVMDAYDELVFEHFAPYLMPLFEEIKILQILKRLVLNMEDGYSEYVENLENQKRSDAAEIKYWRQRLAYATLDEMILDWHAKQKIGEAKLPATELAKQVRKTTDKWGFKLGKDFDRMVAAADERLNEARRTAIAEELAERGIDPSAKTKKK